MRGYTAVQRPSEASKSGSALPVAVHEGPEGGRLGPMIYKRTPDNAGCRDNQSCTRRSA